jgi:hypothetical protein
MVRTERIFKVHSGVRKRHNKLLRRKTPGRADFVQRLVGGDVIVRRNRPATITESKLKAHLPEFERAFAEGRVEVRTPTGLLVDLNTLKVAETLPAPAAQPHPPLDSVKDDKNAGVGEKMPIFKDGVAFDEDVKPPPRPVLPGDDSEESNPVDAQGGDPVAARKKARKKRE